MRNDQALKYRSFLQREHNTVPERDLNIAWLKLIDFCRELQHGEIEILKIQDGLPVLVEVVRKKVKF